MRALRLKQFECLLVSRLRWRVVWISPSIGSLIVVGIYFRKKSTCSWGTEPRCNLVRYPLLRNEGSIHMCRTWKQSLVVVNHGSTLFLHSKGKGSRPDRVSKIFYGPLHVMGCNLYHFAVVTMGMMIWEIATENTNIIQSQGGIGFIYQCYASLPYTFI